MWKSGTKPPTNNSGETGSDGLEGNGWSFLLVYAAAVGTTALAFAGRQIYPAKYSYDGYFIQRIALNQNLVPADPSYRIVANLYRLTGLAQHQTVLAGVSMAIVISLTALALRTGRGFRTPPHVIFLAIAALTTGAVFLSWYSKDIFALLFVSLPTVWLASRPKARASIRAKVFILISMLVYAALFRSYWLVIAGAFIWLRGLAALFDYGRRRTRPLLILILCSQVFLFIFCLIYSAHTGHLADYARTSVNETRISGIDASSAINPFVPDTSTLAGYINVGLTQFALVLPLPLLFSGIGPHVAYAIVIGSIWVPLIFSMRRAWPQKSDDERAQILDIAALAIAILSVLAVFEPDYGSYLRHISPFLPILIVLRLRLAALPESEKPAPSLKRDDVVAKKLANSPTP